jgi:transposase
MSIIELVNENKRLREALEKQNKALAEKDKLIVHSWITKLFPQVLPGSLIGKAITYTLDNWEQLVTYVDNPECVPSNNMEENAIRPFAIGKKNWLFCATPAGAEASAIIYSLIESAKLNRLRSL